MTSFVEGAGADAATSASTGTPVEATDAPASDTSFALSDDIMDSDDLDTLTLPAEEPSAPSPQKDAAAVTPAAKEGVAVPSPEKEKVAASPVSAQPTPTQPTQVATPSPPQPADASRPLTGEELVAQLTANRDALVDAIAKQHFALSPADVDALEVDAVGTIPKLLARGFYAASVNAVQLINNMVPRMVEHVTSEKVKNQEVTNDFFKAWPGIDKNNADHVRTVALLADGYGKMNPKASMADAMRYVGEAASVFLKLPAQAPAKSQNGNGRVASQPRTFVPAAAAGAPTTPGVATTSSNPFEGLGLSFDE